MIYVYIDIRMSALCASVCCSCASLLTYHAPHHTNTRGLSVGGYFVPYQQGILRLQRQKTMRVALKMISTNRPVGEGVMCKLVPRKNVPPSPNLLDCQCLYVHGLCGCGLLPDKLRKAEGTTLERAPTAFTHASSSPAN